jgi:cell division protein ZapA
VGESRVVTVDIGGQRYPIRSSLDERYVAELAAYVDQKLRAASDAAPASDMLGLAVLVALNIADEFFRARDLQSSTHGELNERAMRLEAMVDGILAQAADRKAVSAP